MASLVVVVVISLISGFFVSTILTIDPDGDVDLDFGGITNYKTDIRQLKAWRNLEEDGDVRERPTRWSEPRENEKKSEAILERDKRWFGFNMGYTKECDDDMAYVDDYMSKQYVSYSKSPSWQKQMVDANTGIESGLVNAHIVWSGDYYECINLKAWKNTNTSLSRGPDIVGKYCLAILGVIVVATPLRVGFCIPESCPKNQAQMYLSRKKLPFRIFIEEEFCQTEKAPEWDSIGTYIWWLFATLTAIMMAATIYDISLHFRAWLKARRERGTLMISMKNLAPTKRKQSTWHQLVLSFSALSNTKKIMDTSPATNDATYLSCLHGLKTITMSWVVMGHCCVMLNQLFAWKNGVDILEFLKSFVLQAIGGAEFSVDTFITITGFLVVYVVMRETKKHGQGFNPLVFYAHRIIRLWPPFAVLIAYTCGIAAHLVRGPISPAAFKDQNICRKVWWKALLFIQVYFMEKEKCLPHIWYLCIDMCFIILAPIFLFPLIKKPKVGYGIMSVMLIISIAIPFTLIHLHDLGAFPARNISAKKREEFMHEVYDVPWGRMHCFIIGAAAGYIYYRWGNGMRIPKAIVAFMWLFAGSTMFAMVFGTLRYSSGRAPMTHNMSVIYGTFTRPTWSIGVSWIIIACATGYGGVVNKILSWKGFIPFSRLSYSAYLVHFSVIGQLVASEKEPYMVTIYFMAYLIVSVFFITMFFAWLMTILVEAPVIQAEALLMRIVLESLNGKSSSAEKSAALNKKLGEYHKLTTTTGISNGPLLVPVQEQVEDYSDNNSKMDNKMTDMTIESDSEVFWDIMDTSVEKKGAV